MLANHVEIQLLQHLQIVHHSFSVRGRVYTIRPESLIQSAEHENWLAVQDRRHDAIYFCLGDCSEARVALDFIVA